MTDAAPQARHVVAACYLGWTLDAFDFFVMVFLFQDVAAQFGTTVTVTTWAVTLTLVMRALGALLFGRLADRWGRRPVLMASVLGYALFEFASGLAPTLGAFLVLRALFGVAMGGEWGVGASLTMETIPARWRGPVSGLLQAGYPSGYLLATVLFWLGHDALGWRGMFMVGALPALLVLFIRANVPESPDWLAARGTATHRPSLLPTLQRHWRLTVHAVALMTAFAFFSHGTQDLYPRAFLGGQLHLSHNQISAVAITYNLGAILGGLVVGSVSQHVGRRAAIAAAAVLTLPLIPLWAFSTTPLWLGVGAFCMQLLVQGAWGVVPAYLNELSPAGIRATFPGLVYQLGNLLAAGNATIQSAVADRLDGDYRWPLAGTVAVVAVALAGLALAGAASAEPSKPRSVRSAGP